MRAASMRCAVLLSALACAMPLHAACSRPVTGSLVGAERMVGSLRPEKGGQARVFAYDGTEFTAGEALWMKGRLRLAAAACARSDDAGARPYLKQVMDLLRSRSLRY